MYRPKLLVYFNIASFFGYGMIIILFILLNFSNIDIKITTKFIVTIICCFLIILDFLSNILHCDYNKKKWTIFEQWKNSWLHRGIILSILNFFPIVVFFITWLMYENSKLLNLCIMPTALLSLSILFCSSMIYSNIKKIPVRNNSLIPSIYILNSLISGSLTLFCIFCIFEKYNYFLFNFLIFIIPITLLLKILYLFSSGDTKKKNSMESKIIQHFVAIIFMYILPLYTLWNTPKLYINKEVSEIIYILTLLFFIIGMLIKRKLFFAETEYWKSLYYEIK